MVKSATVTLSVNPVVKVGTDLVVSVTDFATGDPLIEVEVGTKVNIQVRLTRLDTGDGILGKNVKLEKMKPDGTMLPYTMLYTDSFGQASSSLLLNMEGTYSFWATFEGDEQFEGCEEEVTAGDFVW